MKLPEDGWGGGWALGCAARYKEWPNKLKTLKPDRSSEVEAKWKKKKKKNRRGRRVVRSENSK